MDAGMLEPFIESVRDTLMQFGIPVSAHGAPVSRDELASSREVTSMIGIVGKKRGNVLYSCEKETATRIVSAMMMGMPVPVLDDMACSAIAELANMITGGAVTRLAGTIGGLDITPPTVIHGEDMLFMMGAVRTISVELPTEWGPVEISLAWDA